MLILTPLVLISHLYFNSVGTHYHKYCHNHKKGCSFRQYYGYHSEGDQSVIFYDTNWAQMQYFVSGSETAFEVKMLVKFDAELLLATSRKLTSTTTATAMKWNQKDVPCMIKQHMSFLSLVKGKYPFIDACNLQSLVD